jgi:hypothetical protein
LPKAMAALSSGNTIPAITSAIRVAPAFSAQPNISSPTAPHYPRRQPFVADLYGSTITGCGAVEDHLLAHSGLCSYNN